MPDLATARAANDLCLSCGLCCSGLLFGHVSVDANDTAVTEMLGLSLKPKVKHKLKHPCQFLDDGKCSIYLDRPARCHGFACKLRANVLRADVDASEGREVVDETKELLQRLSALCASVGLKGPIALGYRLFSSEFVDSMRKKLSNKSPISETEFQIMTLVFRISAIVDRRFRDTSRPNKYGDVLLELEDAMKVQSRSSAP